mmetsp:Transcript_39092/g.81795  ORF Transcript_39092/g.81795 Transcript_39092/m.81795 type:complete len:478 (+) Transcript_39092:153-1586(+)
MRNIPILFALLGRITTLVAGVGASGIGKPHSTVITLKEKNFDDHLNDAANGLWLLKFYAPWCGHCKKLAPVLDAVAPFLAGKMSIGKVDCTSEKKLCDRFEIRGYPTMKYYRDGEFQDYPLGRDKDSIITFGEKMSDRAVKVISTRQQATEQLLNKIPVAFVVYDPDASSSDASGNIDASGATDEEKSLEKLIRSTERTRAFGQVARMMQASGSFGLLSPDAAPGELRKFFAAEEDGATAAPDGAFIARIEEDVPTKLYVGDSNSADLLEFAREQNLATIVELGGHNFRFVSRRGKALAIAVVDPSDEVRTSEFERELKRYAIYGEHADDYIYGTMDGTKWDKFVAQFSIARGSLPELFVIDVPGRVYWQNASVTGVSEFIAAVKSGEIESREQEKLKKGPLDEFLQVFVDYMPWSLMVMFALFIGVFMLVMPWLGGDDIVYPPTPPKTGRVVKENEVLTGESIEKDDSDDSNKKDR